MQKIEKKIKDNILLRIDLTRNKFIALKNNRPLLGKGNDRGIFNKVPYFVFIGEMFDVSSLDLSEVGLYLVKDGSLQVDFVLKKESDVRQVCLPFSLGSSLLPAVVYYYYSISVVGSLSDTKGGDVVFVVSKDIDQRDIIKLKMRFPDSRFVFFDGEQKVTVDGRNDDLNQGVFAKVRSVDVANEAELGLLSENPVFVARVYLRKLQWEKLRSMPLRFLFENSDIEAILVFLDMMERNSAEKEELLQYSDVIKEVKGYYHLIQPLFVYEEEAMEQYFSKLREFSFLLHLQEIFEAQLSLYKKKNNKSRKKENYLLKLLSKLAEIMPEE